jgi:uncharacterized protein YecT (DUF1311 family)
MTVLTFHRAASLPRAMFVVPVLLLAAASCGAAAAQATDTYAACMTKAQTTVAMQDCQKAGLAEVDKQLGDAYARAMAALPEDQKAKLLAAERLWITFRSADCGVFTGKTTGTISTVQVGSCMIDRAKQRIVDLGNFIAK